MTNLAASRLSRDDPFQTRRSQVASNKDLYFVSLFGIKESFGDRHLIVDYSFAWIGGLFAYHELSDALIIT